MDENIMQIVGRGIGFILIFIGLLIFTDEPLFGLILMAGGGLLIYMTLQKKPSVSPEAQAVSQAAQQVAPSGTVMLPSAQAPTRLVVQPGTTKVALAYLEAPSGRLIVSSIDQPFYRSDFAGIVPPGLLDTLSQSKPQFIIRFRGGRFYIEDPGSTNGTLLNGRQIRGMGMQELRDGDIISPAGVVNLVFRIVS